MRLWRGQMKSTKLDKSIKVNKKVWKKLHEIKIDGEFDSINDILEDFVIGKCFKDVRKRKR